VYIKKRPLVEKMQCSRDLTSMKAKVRFEFYNDVLDRQEVETMWADIVDEAKGIYKLDNIPFFVTSFACGDIVKAKKIDDGFPTVIKLVEESGNSTINITFLSNEQPNKSDILKNLNDLGVDYEGMESLLPGYYSLNIPQRVNYLAVREFLSSKEDVLDFREACIGHDI
jgi:hypothetical protein